MAEERLQKFLASAGLGSRRAAEGMVEAGRVRVNGQIVTELGTKVDPQKARVEVDGRRVMRQPFVYLVLHKPRGCVSTLRDPEGRETVAELVKDVPARLVPVGRLDYASSGVLLMTNDGDFMAKLLHPSGGAEKVYHAKVRGIVDERGLERWRRSIEIDGRRTRPAQVRLLEVIEDKTWLEIVLHEGKNRQIRRLGDEAGNPVLRLIRVEYAGLDVDRMKPGQWRYLSRDELVELKRRFGVPKHMPHAMPAKPDAHHGRRVQSVKPSQADRDPARSSRALPSKNFRGRKMPERPARGNPSESRPTRTSLKARSRPAKRH